MVTFTSLKSKDELKAFNTHLESVSYVDGWTPSATDVELADKLGAAPAKEYTNIVRWFKHIASFDKATKAKWGKAGTSGAAAAADDDEDIDLFASEEEEDDEEKEKLKADRLAAYAAKKSKKPGPIAKSSILMDVKPWDDETDMKAMEAAVRGIEQDGLLWGAAKLVAVGYGIKKLQILAIVEDEKVSVDDLTEKICDDLEEFVQSVDIAAFNKI